MEKARDGCFFSPPPALLPPPLYAHHQPDANAEAIARLPPLLCVATPAHHPLFS